MPKMRKVSKTLPDGSVEESFEEVPTDQLGDGSKLKLPDGQGLKSKYPGSSGKPKLSGLDGQLPDGQDPDMPKMRKVSKTLPDGSVEESFEEVPTDQLGDGSKLKLPDGQGLKSKYPGSSGKPKLSGLDGQLPDGQDPDMPKMRKVSKTLPDGSVEESFEEVPTDQLGDGSKLKLPDGQGLKSKYPGSSGKPKLSGLDGQLPDGQDPDMPKMRKVSKTLPDGSVEESFEEVPTDQLGDGSKLKLPDGQGLKSKYPGSSGKPKLSGLDGQLPDGQDPDMPKMRKVSKTLPDGSVEESFEEVPTDQLGDGSKLKLPDGQGLKSKYPGSSGKPKLSGLDGQLPDGQDPDMPKMRKVSKTLPDGSVEESFEEVPTDQLGDGSKLKLPDGQGLKSKYPGSSGKPKLSGLDGQLPDGQDPDMPKMRKVSKTLPDGSVEESFEEVPTDQLGDGSKLKLPDGQGLKSKYPGSSGKPKLSGLDGQLPDGQDPDMPKMRKVSKTLPDGSVEESFEEVPTDQLGDGSKLKLPDGQGLKSKYPGSSGKPKLSGLDGQLPDGQDPDMPKMRKVSKTLPDGSVEESFEEVPTDQLGDGSKLKLPDGQGLKSKYPGSSGKPKLSGLDGQLPDGQDPDMPKMRKVSKTLPDGSVEESFEEVPTDQLGDGSKLKLPDGQGLKSKYPGSSGKPKLSGLDGQLPDGQDPDMPKMRKVSKTLPDGSVEESFEEVPTDQLGDGSKLKLPDGQGLKSKYPGSSGKPKLSGLDGQLPDGQDPDMPKMRKVSKTLPDGSVEESFEEVPTDQLGDGSKLKLPDGQGLKSKYPGSSGKPKLSGLDGQLPDGQDPDMPKMRKVSKTLPDGSVEESFEEVPTDQLGDGSKLKLPDGQGLKSKYPGSSGKPKLSGLDGQLPDGQDPDMPKMRKVSKTLPDGSVEESFEEVPTDQLGDGSKLKLPDGQGLKSKYPGSSGKPKLSGLDGQLPDGQDPDMPKMRKVSKTLPDGSVEESFEEVPTDQLGDGSKLKLPDGQGLKSKYPGSSGKPKLPGLDGQLPDGQDPDMPKMRKVSKTLPDGSVEESFEEVPTDQLGDGSKLKLPDGQGLKSKYPGSSGKPKLSGLDGQLPDGQDPDMPKMRKVSKTLPDGSVEESFEEVPTDQLGDGSKLKLPDGQGLKSKYPGSSGKPKLSGLDGQLPDGQDPDMPKMRKVSKTLPDGSVEESFEEVPTDQLGDGSKLKLPDGQGLKSKYPGSSGKPKLPGLDGQLPDGQDPDMPKMRKVSKTLPDGSVEESFEEVPTDQLGDGSKLKLPDGQGLKSKYPGSSGKPKLSGLDGQLPDGQDPDMPKMRKVSKTLPDGSVEESFEEVPTDQLGDGSKLKLPDGQGLKSKYPGSSGKPKLSGLDGQLPDGQDPDMPKMRKVSKTLPDGSVEESFEEVPTDQLGDGSKLKLPDGQGLKSKYPGSSGKPKLSGLDGQLPDGQDPDMPKMRKVSKTLPDGSVEESFEEVPTDQLGDGSKLKLPDGQGLKSKYPGSSGKPKLSGLDGQLPDGQDPDMPKMRKVSKTLPDGSVEESFEEVPTDQLGDGSKLKLPDGQGLKSKYPGSSGKPKLSGLDGQLPDGQDPDMPKMRKVSKTLPDGSVEESFEEVPTDQLGDGSKLKLPDGQGLKSKYPGSSGKPKLPGLDGQLPDGQDPDMPKMRKVSKTLPDGSVEESFEEVPTDQLGDGSKLKLPDGQGLKSKYPGSSGKPKLSGLDGQLPDGQDPDMPKMRKVSKTLPDGSVEESFEEVPTDQLGDGSKLKLPDGQGLKSKYPGSSGKPKLSGLDGQLPDGQDPDMPKMRKVSKTLPDGSVEESFEEVPTDQLGDGSKLKLPDGQGLKSKYPGSSGKPKLSGLDGQLPDGQDPDMPKMRKVSKTLPDGSVEESFEEVPTDQLGDGSKLKLPDGQGLKSKYPGSSGKPKLSGLDGQLPDGQDPDMPKMRKVSKTLPDGSVEESFEEVPTDQLGDGSKLKLPDGQGLKSKYPGSSGKPKLPGLDGQLPDGQDPDMPKMRKVSKTLPDGSVEESFEEVPSDPSSDPNNSNGQGQPKNPGSPGQQPGGQDPSKPQTRKVVKTLPDGSTEETIEEVPTDPSSDPNNPNGQGQPKNPGSPGQQPGGQDPSKPKTRKVVKTLPDGSTEETIEEVPTDPSSDPNNPNGQGQPKNPGSPGQQPGGQDPSKPKTRKVVKTLPDGSTEETIEEVPTDPSSDPNNPNGQGQPKNPGSPGQQPGGQDPSKPKTRKVVKTLPDGSTEETIEEVPTDPSSDPNNPNGQGQPKNPGSPGQQPGGQDPSKPKTRKVVKTLPDGSTEETIEEVPTDPSSDPNNPNGQGQPKNPGSPGQQPGGQDPSKPKTRKVVKTLPDGSTEETIEEVPTDPSSDPNNPNGQGQPKNPGSPGQQPGGQDPSKPKTRKVVKTLPDGSTEETIEEVPTDPSSDPNNPNGQGQPKNPGSPGQQPGGQDPSKPKTRKVVKTLPDGSTEETIEEVPTDPSSDPNNPNGQGQPKNPGSPGQQPGGQDPSKPKTRKVVKTLPDGSTEETIEEVPTDPSSDPNNPNGQGQPKNPGSPGQQPGGQDPSKPKTRKVVKTLPDGSTEETIEEVPTDPSSDPNNPNGQGQPKNPGSPGQQPGGQDPSKPKTRKVVKTLPDGSTEETIEEVPTDPSSDPNNPNGQGQPKNPGSPGQQPGGQDPSKPKTRKVVKTLPDGSTEETIEEVPTDPSSDPNNPNGQGQPKNPGSPGQQPGGQDPSKPKTRKVVKTLPDGSTEETIEEVPTDPSSDPNNPNGQGQPKNPGSPGQQPGGQDPSKPKTRKVVKTLPDGSTEETIEEVPTDPSSDPNNPNGQGQPKNPGSPGQQPGGQDPSKPKTRKVVKTLPDGSTEETIEEVPTDPSSDPNNPNGQGQPKNPGSPGQQPGGQDPSKPKTRKVVKTLPDGSTEETIEELPTDPSSDPNNPNGQGQPKNPGSPGQQPGGQDPSKPKTRKVVKTLPDGSTEETIEEVPTDPSSDPNNPNGQGQPKNPGSPGQQPDGQDPSKPKTRKVVKTLPDGSTEETIEEVPTDPSSDPNNPNGQGQPKNPGSPGQQPGGQDPSKPKTRKVVKTLPDGSTEETIEEVPTDQSSDPNNPNGQGQPKNPGSHGQQPDGQDPIAQKLRSGSSKNPKIPDDVTDDDHTRRVRIRHKKIHHKAKGKRPSYDEDKVFTEVSVLSPEEENLFSNPTSSQPGSSTGPTVVAPQTGPMSATKKPRPPPRTRRVTIRRPDGSVEQRVEELPEEPEEWLAASQDPASKPAVVKAPGGPRKKRITKIRRRGPPGRQVVVEESVVTEILPPLSTPSHPATIVVEDVYTEIVPETTTLASLGEPVVVTEIFETDDNSPVRSEPEIVVTEVIETFMERGTQQPGTEVEDETVIIDSIKPSRNASKTGTHDDTSVFIEYEDDPDNVTDSASTPMIEDVAPVSGDASTTVATGPDDNAPGFLTTMAPQDMSTTVGEEQDPVSQNPEATPDPGDQSTVVVDDEVAVTEVQEAADNSTDTDQATVAVDEEVTVTEVNDAEETGSSTTATDDATVAVDDEVAVTQISESADNSTDGQTTMEPTVAVDEQLVVTEVTTEPEQYSTNEPGTVAVDDEVVVTGVTTEADQNATDTSMESTVAVDEAVAVTGVTTEETNEAAAEGSTVAVDDEVVVTGVTTEDATDGSEATTDGSTVAVDDEVVVTGVTTEDAVDGSEATTDGSTVAVDEEIVVTGVTTEDAADGSEAITEGSTVAVDEEVVVTGVTTEETNGTAAEGSTVAVDEEVVVTGVTTEDATDGSEATTEGSTVAVDEEVVVTGVTTQDVADGSEGTTEGSTVAVDDEVVVTGVTTEDAANGTELTTEGSTVAVDDEVVVTGVTTEESASYTEFTTEGSTVAVDEEIVVTGVVTEDAASGTEMSTEGSTVAVDDEVIVTGVTTEEDQNVTDASMVSTVAVDEQVSVTGVSTEDTANSAESTTDGATVAVDEEVVVTGVTTEADGNSTEVNMESTVAADEAVTVTGVTTEEAMTEPTDYSTVAVDEEVVVTGVTTEADQNSTEINMDSTVAVDEAVMATGVTTEDATTADGSTVAVDAQEVVTNVQSTEVTDGTTEVTDGTTEVTGGTTEVTDGTTEVTDGTTEVTDGTTVVTDGTTEVTDGTTVVTDGTTEASATSSTVAVDDIGTQTEATTESVTDSTTAVSTNATDEYEDVTEFYTEPDMTTLAATTEAQSATSDDEEVVTEFYTDPDTTTVSVTTEAQDTTTEEEDVTEVEETYTEVYYRTRKPRTTTPKPTTVAETTEAAETTTVTEALETTTIVETTEAPESTTVAATTEPPEMTTVAATTESLETTTVIETTAAPESTTVAATTEAPEMTTVAAAPESLETTTVLETTEAPEMTTVALTTEAPEMTTVAATTEAPESITAAAAPESFESTSEPSSSKVTEGQVALAPNIGDDDSATVQPQVKIEDTTLDPEVKMAPGDEDGNGTTAAPGDAPAASAGGATTVSPAGASATTKAAGTTTAKPMKIINVPVKADDCNTKVQHVPIVPISEIEKKQEPKAADDDYEDDGNYVISYSGYVPNGRGGSTYVRNAAPVWAPPGGGNQYGFYNMYSQPQYGQYRQYGRRKKRQAFYW
ncbi:hypothetical protein HDE_11026 [Halotydeus destructor]|nr:hypothetical protein HDE_11026 [Halotydeus destructor]